VDFIEKWRIAFGDLKGFFLAGHSFGGYISGHYACKYPQNLKKVLMLSPAGVVKRPEDFDFANMKFKNGRSPPSWVKSLATSAWENQWSPFGVMRKSGSLIGKSLIKNYVNKRMPNLPEDEREVMHDYMH
jgi:cardiolipin-specific phospholipase